MVEENSFLRTLETGIRKFDAYESKTIDGAFAFELYDTFGFPIDLTRLMAREKGVEVDMKGFNECMAEQKIRSRKAGSISTDDWIMVNETEEAIFTGYESLKEQTELIKYRKVKKLLRRFWIKRRNVLKLAWTSRLYQLLCCSR